MTGRQLLIGSALAAFAALNAWVVGQYGYLGFLREALSSLAGIAVMIDLTIALTMVAVWMWNDARRRGIAVVPYLVVGLFLGSVGPLLYLLRTGGSEAPALGGAPLPVSGR